MVFIGIVSSWQQAVTWLVLIFVLYSIVSGKIRYDLAAFGGLLILGVLGLRKPLELFSGFASPALFTIATVLVMSAGIVESGLLSGLGRRIGEKIHKPQSQILIIFLTTGFISAFMNNVGAIGIMFPTAKRMAARATVPQVAFGIPRAYASILGGSLTLIGTASNLIVSSYRIAAFGEPFSMFDFSFHGIILLLSGITVVFLCRICGLGLIGRNQVIEDDQGTEERDIKTENIHSQYSRKSLLVLITLIPAIVFTGMGLFHPSVVFGIVTLLWIFSGVFSYKKALSNINLPIILFLGSMFGISGVLEDTGALKSVVDLITPVFSFLPPILLIMIFLFITALFANILDNSVAAVLMAPVAVALWKSGAVPFDPDALLMAVAAGASLGLVMPTHQATIVVMNSMDFPQKNFMQTGAAIATLAGITASFLIYAIWS